MRRPLHSLKRRRWYEMSAGAIRVDIRGAVCRIVLDQPSKLNAMNFDMWLALPEAVQRAEREPGVRVITLEGAGEKAFCAGADISQFGDKRTGTEATRAYDAAVAAGNEALFQCSKPTVALIRGIAFGGGLMLALTCDIRLAQANSRFRLPAGRLGLGYALSNITLMVQRLGMTATADILMSARILDASDAQRAGIATHVWSADEFEAHSDAYVQQIARNAPLTLKAMKRALVELSRREIDQDLTAVNTLVEQCFTSADYREGQAAFREKREPVFTGQ